MGTPAAWWCRMSPRAGRDSGAVISPCVTASHHGDCAECSAVVAVSTSYSSPPLAWNASAIPVSPVPAERITQTVEITKHVVDIEEKGVKLRLTIVDTPGFGDAVNNTEWCDPGHILSMGRGMERPQGWGSGDGDVCAGSPLLLGDTMAYAVLGT